ncbi:hypothetical protein [Haliangium ochraceum]|uniref:Uncharacterized protein n=1 Tax=Haliangium ochraceum (strain DSM 14365 / JCM 11303 / SMP-2) TaxID=502025 RepID=D0LS35_HALO1|nr:hypothetical protein [Haliangium ochraceum]ACY13732.1 hypothetical protein Hoch_1165 [Haliangium ochraceum DSM 14365]
MAEATTNKTAPSNNDSLIVVDVGKKFRRKQIRKLRKGRGKLMGRVEQLVSDLQDNDALGDNAKPVVIVVREKKKKMRFW